MQNKAANTELRGIDIIKSNRKLYRISFGESFFQKTAFGDENILSSYLIHCLAELIFENSICNI